MRPRVAAAAAVLLTACGGTDDPAAEPYHPGASAPGRTLEACGQLLEAVEAIRYVVPRCPTDGTTVWTELEGDTGYDSVTFTASSAEGLGLTTFQVTRVGNAVLFTEVYGEGAIGDGPVVAEHRTDLTKQIATSLCVFTAAGC